MIFLFGTSHSVLWHLVTVEISRLWAIAASSLYGRFHDERMGIIIMVFAYKFEKHLTTKKWSPTFL